MAATRFRSVLPNLRIKSASLVIENGLQIPRILVAQKHDSISSASPESGLLQKLINAPLSRIKAIIDSEFASGPKELPWPEIVTSLHSLSPQKANLVLEWKMENFPTNSEHAYLEMLSLCENTGNVPLAMSIFTSMEARGIQLVSSHFNILISTSLCSHNFLTAISLYEVMKFSENYKPDSTTYNAFISAYAKVRNLEAAEYWLSTKRNCGFPDDAESYAYLIQCCLNTKKFCEAERYYEELLSTGLILSESIFSNMVKIFCEKKNTLKLKEILKVSLDSGLLITHDIASKVVGSYKKYGLVEEMEELLETLMGTNQSTDTRSLFHESLITMYADRDRVDEVEKSVDRMLNEGVSFSSPEKVEKIIQCYLRNEANDKLDDLWKRIKNSLKVSKSTYDLLSSSYEEAGLTDKVNEVINDMKLAGFE